MADSKKLTKFSVEPDGTNFIFSIEDESGHTLELSATRDQVDVIADTLDDILTLDESADEVKDADDDDDDDFDDDDEFEDDDEDPDDEDEVHDKVAPKKRGLT